jgi:hypothetical protein
LEPASETLKAMTAEYESAVTTVSAAGDPEYVDFHARRLVEMAGYIIIGYLLLQDASRDESYIRSAALFVKYGQAKAAAHAAFIRDFHPEDLNAYKKA